MKCTLVSLALLGSMVAGFTASRVMPSIPAANASASMQMPASASVVLPSMQCQGRTLAGNRCKRKTTAASGFCFQHSWQAGERTAREVSVL